MFGRTEKGRGREFNLRGKPLFVERTLGVCHAPSKQQACARLRSNRLFFFRIDRTPYNVLYSKRQEHTTLTSISDGLNVNKTSTSCFPPVAALGGGVSARRWQHDSVVKLPRCVPCLLPLIKAAGTRGLDECKKLELMIADEKKKVATTNARDAAFMVDSHRDRERASER